MAGGERRPLCENKIQTKTEETSRHEKGKNGSGRAAHDCDLGTHIHARTRERVGEEKEVYASADDSQVTQLLLARALEIQCRTPNLCVSTHTLSIIHP